MPSASNAPLSSAQCRASAAPQRQKPMPCLSALSGSARSQRLVELGASSNARRSREPFPNPASSGPIGQPREQLHSRQGAKRPAKPQVGCSGSRVRLPLSPSSLSGTVNSRSVVIEPSAARSGLRRFSPSPTAKTGSLSSQQCLVTACRVQPNPLLKLTRYGTQRKPGPRPLRHHRVPGLRCVPPRAA